MEGRETKAQAQKRFRLRIALTHADLGRLEQQAQERGYAFYTLIRYKLLRGLRGTRMRFYPSADILALAALLGSLQVITGEIKSVGSSLITLSKVPRHDHRITSGISSSLDDLEKIGHALLDLLDRLTSAISKATIHHPKR